MNKTVKNSIVLFTIGTVVFVIGTFFFSNFKFDTFQDFIITFGFYQLYSFSIGLVNTQFFSYLESINWKKKDFALRILVGVLGSVILTLATLFFLRMFTDVVYVGNSFETFIANENIKSYIFGLWITLSMVAIFHFVYFYNAFQQNKIKKSQYVAKKASANFESLKNQLDPHFLFNSLNVLTSLIGENPKQAEKFTTKLSKVYRYVLEQKDKDLIPLKEELAFAKSYMDLLQMRFEDAIDFTIEIPTNETELKIVPLSLQLLLENAVKHNVISSSNPLKIRIYKENNYLVVENNKNLKNTLEKSTKVGLKNIHQRYHLISNKKVAIVDSIDVFKVKLPLLTQKSTIMQIQQQSDNMKYYKAKKKVDDLKAFYGNLISYCIVIPILFFIWYRYTPSVVQWFWFPALGWGFGLVMHALRVFGLGTNWENRKIQEFMDNDL